MFTILNKLLLFKKSRLLFISIIILVFFSHEFATSQVVVTPSDDKITIDGKVYFLHVVKPGQTIYSISKAYMLPEEEIINENPGADMGIRIGQVLKIPTKAKDIQVQKEPLTSPGDTSFNWHEVISGETVYSIALNYKINIEELESANPEIKDHQIQAGQVIKIPLKTRTSDVAFIWHTVKRKETIYGISKMYGISEESLKEFNPELYSKLPRIGQDLRIPVPEKPIIVMDSISNVENLPGNIPEFQKIDTSELVNNYAFYMDSLEVSPGSEFDVAYLIPFNYKPLDQLLPRETEDQIMENAEIVNPQAILDNQMLLSKNFLEFIQGSLLALNRLKNEGINVTIHVFDTRKSPTRVREILESKEFRDIDLIIGPFYAYNIEIVNEYSRSNHIPLISPVSSRPELATSNPLFFQVNTEFTTEFRVLSEYISGFSGRNLIMVYGSDSTENVKYAYLKEQLINRLKEKNKYDSLMIHELKFDVATHTEFTRQLEIVLTKDTANLVIIPFGDEAFASAIVTQLFFKLMEHKISVVGMPHWSAFQNIDLNYFHKLNVSYLTPYYYSYDSMDVDHFLMTYRNTFFVEPVAFTKKGCPYAFIGYDLSYFFLKNYSLYGKKFLLHLDDENIHELMNNFYFVPLEDRSGFENRSLILVRHLENLDIKAFPAFKGNSYLLNDSMGIY